MKETYTIKETSEQTGVSIDTLRYYERVGLIHSIERLPNSHRRYSSDDVEWIEFLLRLRATGMSIQQMLPYAELQRLGQLVLKERVALLQAHQQRLEDQMQQMQEFLRVIKAKIQHYQKQMEQEAD
ncbi:MAG TPA: MerR family transcriptional regulator [Ktedonobacteraceae bacterium]|nr:MerR family transcriptional regulator [Ktedonobacteraceae bacterium]